MEFIQLQAYAGFMFGAAVMINLHNMFVSFFLYKARQTNVSNLLKIVFNFGNVLRLGAAWGSYILPSQATIVQCSGLQYSAAFGNVAVRLSLVAFLLWRLKQIHQSKIDDRVSIIVFTLRAGLGIAQLGLQRPETLAIPDENVIICNPNELKNIYYTAAGFAIEFFTDIYVTVRLIQILRKANRNAAQIASNMGQKSKRSLFTAVMYWNFLRLFVAIAFHMTPILNQTIDGGFNEVLVLTTIPIVNIILSYVITVDAEIVRVIEGREKKKNSSAGSEKSMIQSPRTPRTPHHYSGDLPKYTPHESSDENFSQIDDNKVVVVSMKRLSFFEWANVVVGKRIRRDNDDEIGVDEDDVDIEEIIDGPSKESKSKEISEEESKEETQDRRDSNFSGSTTLDEDPSIVIQ